MNHQLAQQRDDEIYLRTLSFDRFKPSPQFTDFPVRQVWFGGHSGQST
jgi:hypothetical protein